MRRAGDPQRPPAWAKPTASHSAIGMCSTVSTSVEPSGREGVDVGEQSGRGERQGQPQAAAPAEPALPGEVPGQQNQRQEGEVAGMEAFAAGKHRAAEQLGRFHPRGARGSEAENDEDLPPGAVRAAAGDGAGDQLFPQAGQIRRGEPSRLRVGAADPPDRHEESLLWLKAGLHQRGRFPAQEALLLLQFGAGNPPPPHGGAPLRDPGFHTVAEIFFRHECVRPGAPLIITGPVPQDAGGRVR